MTTTHLLSSIRDHLAEFELPEPCGVTVHPALGYGHDAVRVQLSGGALPYVAEVLLAWADTLTDVTAQTWRVPKGYSVHLSVRGRLADGTAVTVFDGVDHDDLFALAPSEQRPVSPACLREWAALDEGVTA
jgi:hypothetical protein